MSGNKRLALVFFFSDFTKMELPEMQPINRFSSRLAVDPMVTKTLKLGIVWNRDPKKLETLAQTLKSLEPNLRVGIEDIWGVRFLAADMPRNGGWDRYHGVNQVKFLERASNEARQTKPMSADEQMRRLDKGQSIPAADRIWGSATSADIERLNPDEIGFEDRILSLSGQRDDVVLQWSREFRIKQLRENSRNKANGTSNLNH